MVANEPSKSTDQAVSVPKKKTKSTHISFTIIGLLAFALFCFFNLRTVIVSGSSMLPTFYSGQKLLACSAYWLVGPVKDNDVVVVQMSKPGDYIIKRVYRTAGETVEWYKAPASWRLINGEYRVPPGEIYVLGDNQAVSEDSRVFGAVPLKHVIGKILRI